MALAELERLFQQPNALKLIRDNRAVLVLSFLREAFSDERKSIGQDELTHRLAEYLEQNNYHPESDETDGSNAENELFGEFRPRAKRLLRDWESRDKRYLRGDNNAEGQYCYTLTEHITRAWQWIDSLVYREFVGTSSRLEDIFEKLQRVVNNSREKTDVERIAELEAKQSEITHQIEQIRAGNLHYQPNPSWYVKEEYDGILEMLAALSTDFRMVESNFEHIRTDILRRQAAQEISKGGLLGHYLDARDQLDLTPQGQSFNAFFDDLRDPRRQSRFSELVRELYGLLETHDIERRDDGALSRLHRRLLSEAQPVLDANRRIADRVARLVAENAAHDRRLMQKLINDIKQAALDPRLLAQLPADEAGFWEIDGDRADIHLPLQPHQLRTHPDESRVRFTPPLPISKERPDIEPEIEEFLQTVLLDRIAAALEQREQLTLADLLTEWPPSEGLTEVLTYLNIAAAPDNRHFFQADQTDILPLGSERAEIVLQGARVFLVK